jgi:hypothetical protein
MSGGEALGVRCWHKFPVRRQIRFSQLLDLNLPRKRARNGLEERGGVSQKSSTNLMNPYPTMAGLLAAPRCWAMSKRTAMPCRAPAVRGKHVCYMHGAGAGAPSGQRNGMYRHGGRTKEAQAERRYLAALLRAAREGLTAIDC